MARDKEGRLDIIFGEELEESSNSNGASEETFTKYGKISIGLWLILAELAHLVIYHS